MTLVQIFQLALPLFMAFGCGNETNFSNSQPKPVPNGASDRSNGVSTIADNDQDAWQGDHRQEMEQAPSASPLPGYSVPSSAITAGSFTVYTEPHDPRPQESYHIVILVALPRHMAEYDHSDLSGNVVGTDGFSLNFDGGSRKSNGYDTFSSNYEESDPSAIRNGQAQVKIWVPGGATLVRDTIQLRSRLLGERQTIVIEF